MKLLDLLKSAVMAGMIEVRKGQLASSTSSEMKKDLSFVTPTDYSSQDAILRVIAEGQEEPFCIKAEEKKGLITSVQNDPNARIHLFVDALDGTGAFKIGIATSTVIIGAYDMLERRMIACVIGDPALGRVWSASEDQPTMLQWYNFETGIVSSAEERKVWSSGQLDKKSTVLIDVTFGFKHSTDGEMIKLFTELMPKVNIQVPGSNGLIQALVANGRDGIVGAISTAPSGPWDLCGAYLVLRAGGFVRAFSKGYYGGLEEQHPYDSFAHQTVVMGCNKEVVNALTEIRLRAGGGAAVEHR